MHLPVQYSEPTVMDVLSSASELERSLFIDKVLDIKNMPTESSLVAEMAVLHLQVVLRLASLRGEDVKVLDGEVEPVAGPRSYGPPTVLHVRVGSWVVSRLDGSRGRVQADIAL